MSHFAVPCLHSQPHSGQLRAALLWSASFRGQNAWEGAGQVPVSGSAFGEKPRASVVTAGAWEGQPCTGDMGVIMATRVPTWPSAQVCRVRAQEASLTLLAAGTRPLVYVRCF